MISVQPDLHHVSACGYELIQVLEARARSSQGNSFRLGEKGRYTNKQHAHRQARHQHCDVLRVMQHGREDKEKLKERSLTLFDSSKFLAIFHERRKSSSTNEGLHLTSSKSTGS